MFGWLKKLFETEDGPQLTPREMVIQAVAEAKGISKEEVTDNTEIYPDMHDVHILLAIMTRKPLYCGPDTTVKDLIDQISA